MPCLTCWEMLPICSRRMMMGRRNGFSADEQRHAFSVWPRTGRVPRVKSVDDVEIKFNPWHDPENGRFTFANTGRYFGRGRGGGFTDGSGGGFGGGGATGAWSDEHFHPQAPRHREARSPRRINVPKPTAAASTAKPTLGQPAQELRSVIRNGYEYQIDVGERMRRVSGTLTLNPAQARSRTAQARAGGVDRRPSDDGGHYIARRFNGPKDAFNHFAQDPNFNRGRYRALEDEWARAKRGGKQVWVKIAPVYEGSSKRPSVINVWFTIDGHPKSEKFPNERKDTSRGKR